MNNELKQLGLTPNEITIYNALLEIGENTVGPILKKVGMHRQVIYDALSGLINRKMIVTTTKNNRAYFRVANPKNILDNIKHQESIAKTLVNEISQRLVGQNVGQEIRIYEGDKALRELTKRNDDMQPKDSEYLVVTGGSSAKFREVMNKANTFERSNRIRRIKNIKSKIIFCASDREGAKDLNRVNSEIRFLPDDYASPTAIAIWHDSINLISYGSEIFCIEIKNKDFYESYKKHFECLWKIARK